MDRAFREKDASYDGVFYAAVKTTGIFCRPSCCSTPALANVEYFGSASECLAAGYRPCKRCRPLEANGAPPDWVRELMSRVERSGSKIGATELRDLGITPERARRWFNAHLGMSFSAWCRSYRLAGAFGRLRQGTSVDNAVFDSGYQSHSGFREAFSRVFGETPGAVRRGGDCMVMAILESPLGALLAGAREEGLAVLEYVEPHRLEHDLRSLRELSGCPMVLGEHQWIAQVRNELDQYFAGCRTEFCVPLAPRGSEFQRRVWDELCEIPYGETISYEELARRIGRPDARRAVARANGANRLSIVIPCHRVIGKNGTLTGYGGGLWRKRLLLERERAGARERSVP
jgi:AraC family transcriptional regulator of adaptative response/methylated-DNA-[protein]-cysteine methyltransferase